MEEKVSKHEFRDTEEMVQWRSINQGRNQQCVVKLVGENAEEVLEKCKVEVWKKRSIQRKR